MNSTQKKAAHICLSFALSCRFAVVRIYTKCRSANDITNTAYAPFIAMIAFDSSTGQTG